jgi:hypothetical protein
MDSLCFIASITCFQAHKMSFCIDINNDCKYYYILGCTSNGTCTVCCYMYRCNCALLFLYTVFTLTLTLPASLSFLLECGNLWIKYTTLRDVLTVQQQGWYVAYHNAARVGRMLKSCRKIVIMDQGKLSKNIREISSANMKRLAV